MKPDFKTIYVQKAAIQYYKERVKAIVSRWPDAKVIEVERHNDISELRDMNPAEWLTAKREILVLGIIKSLDNTPNGRSTDFIAPSGANGCLSGCQYCYVARRKTSNVAGSNPLTLFLNTEGVIASIRKHSDGLGAKQPNQCDPTYWTYDIGCNNDVMGDVMVYDGALQMIEAAKTMKNVKLSFATKNANEVSVNKFLNVKPEGHSRIRYSLMPESYRRVVDIRTSTINERLEAMNRLADAGYEIHANFSPIIVTEGWLNEWVKLFDLMNFTLSSAVKRQLKCEIIMLTHSVDLHNINMNWNPRGEELLWRPDIMAPKRDKPDVLSYDYRLKGGFINDFISTMKRMLPYCEVRYAF